MSNTSIQNKSKSILYSVLNNISEWTTWGAISTTSLLIVYIESGRRLHNPVPIPFLMLFAIVVLWASLGGKWSGYICAFLVSLFIIHSTIVSFGPPTLTGGPLQTASGIILIYLIANHLGKTRDHNNKLIKEAENARNYLEERVAERTHQLLHINKQLSEAIAEHEKAKEALQKSEQQYRLLAENAADVIWTTDQNQRFTYISPSIKSLGGYTVEEAMKLSVQETMTPESFERIRGFYETAHNALLTSSQDLPTTPFVIELEGLRKDKSTVWVEITISFMFDSTNKPISILGVTRDISNRHKAREHIRRQDRLAVVGKLAAGIAHDFNNALSVIMLYAQMMLRTATLSDKERKQLSKINQQADHAVNLTAQILDFSRQSVMKREVIELIPLLEASKEVLNDTFPKNINVILKSTVKNPLIMADSTRIKQAIMNLALNARDAMTDGGELIITLDKMTIEDVNRLMIFGENGKPMFKLSFADSGSGIAPDLIPHLFEPFFTTKTRGKGTGLGLAQVYGIIVKHHGHIDVESEMGQGTTFNIYLPIVEKALVKKTAVSVDGLRQGSGELVLVVEDDEFTRNALIESLEMLQYTVQSANTGLEAMAVLKEARHDIALVISDMIMPEMSGAELVEWMFEQGFKIPVLILTGHPFLNKLEDLQDKGVQDWLSKPVTIEQLSQQIVNALRSNAA